MSWSIVTLCVCGSKRLQSGCPFSALAFYTEVLGFTKRRYVPVGDNFWLTVVSPESPDGPELLLEHPAVKPYRDALVEDGIPLAQFAVDDVEAEHARLTSNGVVFTQPPTDIGTAVVAVFDDTCGNLIQLIEEKPDENHDDAFNIETSTPPEISVA